MVYMPVIIPVLRKLGILDTVQRHAFLNHEGAVWRDIDGNVLGKLPLGGEEKEKKGEFGGVLLIGQARMNSLILEELKKYPSVEVRFGLRCVGIENLPDRESVKVMVHQGSQLDGDLLFEADYVLGTDGANSAVRRILCIPFEGFTWPDWKMIGTDVLYDFPAEMGYTPLTFIVHPNDWAVIAYTGEDADGKPRGAGIPQWRVAYVEPPDLPGSKEEIMKRAYERVATYIKGSKEFKITRAEPYINHQRCAAQAQKGRVLLAGDALHVSNNTRSKVPWLKVASNSRTTQLVASASQVASLTLSAMATPLRALSRAVKPLPYSQIAPLLDWQRGRLPRISPLYQI